MKAIKCTKAVTKDVILQMASVHTNPECTGIINKNGEALFKASIIVINKHEVTYLLTLYYLQRAEFLNPFNPTIDHLDWGLDSHNFIRQYYDKEDYTIVETI